jgi:hypothetical protein
MSIATLKRKTSAKYHTMSVSQPQFSLSGTRRLQGYIGQDMLSRSLPRTPMRGNVPIGYGGCCGTYPTHVNAVYGIGIYSFNDPMVLKPSVLTTEGMLMKRYQYDTSHWHVKQTSYDTTTYLNTRRQQASTHCSSSENTSTIPSCSYTTNCPTKPLVVDIHKETQLLPHSQQEYISTLQHQCTKELNPLSISSRLQTPLPSTGK